MKVNWNNMAQKKVELMVPDEVIINKIYLIRGHKVILDRDLAELYGTETKVLKQTVRRNIKRFPSDFLFEMSIEELHDWRSQFVTSTADKKGIRHPPFCFTEYGIIMLASVLNSDRAININVQIVRIFIKMREFLAESTMLRMDLEKIKKKLENQDKNIELVFNYLDELIEKKKKLETRKRVGFKRKGEH